MKYDRKMHHRQSVRLKSYNYANPGAYFLTLCSWQRECLFGNIVDGELRLNKYGMVVEQEWKCTQDKRPNVELDQYIIMPNHFHGIMIINAGRRGMARHAPTGRQFAKPIANSLSTIIGAFKSAVTKQINQIRNSPGQPVWQRNYYERVIRNEKEFIQIREYIQHNHLQWDNDNDNPVNIQL